MKKKSTAKKKTQPKSKPALKAKRAAPAKTGAPARIVSEIQAIIARQLKKKPNQILLPAKLQTDLGADSLDALEIVFQLEETFNIKIGEEDANRMGSVQDIVRYITQKVNG